jgi:hypothetical protein
MNKLLLLAVSFFAISCATPYQQIGFRGGYSETRLAKDMYEVHFKGNFYTDAQTVRNHLLRRCAELAKSNGYTHFLSVSSNQSSDHGYTSSFNGNTLNTYEISRHGNTMVIKLLNNPDPKYTAYDADMILGKDSQSSRLPAWND